LGRPSRGSGELREPLARLEKEVGEKDLPGRVGTLAGGLS